MASQSPLPSDDSVVRALTLGERARAAGASLQGRLARLDAALGRLLMRIGLRLWLAAAGLHVARLALLMAWEQRRASRAAHADPAPVGPSPLPPVVEALADEVAEEAEEAWADADAALERALAEVRDAEEAGPEVTRG